MKMVERRCLGCPATFRVLEKSLNFYCCIDCYMTDKEAGKSRKFGEAGWKNYKNTKQAFKGIAKKLRGERSNGRNLPTTKLQPSRKT